jgi:hypothetical protein
MLMMEVGDVGADDVEEGKEDTLHVTASRCLSSRHHLALQSPLLARLPVHALSYTLWTWSALGSHLCLRRRSYPSHTYSTHQLCWLCTAFSTSLTASLRVSDC